MDEAKQYLTFMLGEEVFGVDVIHIKEILEIVNITKIPQTPDYMCGVINLRGSVVPVVDIKLKFGMGKVEKSVNTCSIVLELVIDNKKMLLGALVDSVQEVFELQSGEIEAVPKMGAKIRTEFINGMSKRGDKCIILLDINGIFSFKELEYIQDSSRFEL